MEYDYWQPDDLGSLDQPGAQQPEWDVVSSNPNYTYADEYDKGFGGANQTGSDAIPAEGVELYPGWTGTGLTGVINALTRAGGGSGLLGKGLDLLTSKYGLMALLAALGAANKAPPRGGGVAYAYKGPEKQLTSTIEQGQYGPVQRLAAQGGIMHAYASGGQVRPFPMQDGGFVFTKRAVDGAGGPQGIKQLVPEARMIRGPGHGTSDSIPAYIQGRNSVTPARVSNGEAYAPPGRKTKDMYALMKQLERMA